MFTLKNLKLFLHEVKKCVDSRYLYVARNI